MNMLAEQVDQNAQEDKNGGKRGYQQDVVTARTVEKSGKHVEYHWFRSGFEQESKKTRKSVLYGRTIENGSAVNGL